MVDFGRMNQIKRAIEHDFDVRARRDVPSEAFLPLRWNATVLQILKLPVAAWDCPATAAGEIDTERAKNMWNQGSGNGDDVYGRLNNTKDVGGAKFPFIEDGRHKLALCVLEEFQHSTDGPSARAIFEVLESPKHQVGSYVVKIWKLVKPPKFQGQNSDADLFADFCRKLKGAPVGYPIGNDIRVLMKERPRDQLARGTVIECSGVRNAKGTWTNLYWNAVPQSPQDIATMRQRLEAKGIPDSGGGSAPAPQQYGQQPAAPAQGVPPGGFLANVPPTGGYGNGGQQGGGGGTW